MRKVTKKIEEVKSKTELPEVSKGPQIDEGSRRIVEDKLAEQRGSKPIHERLHDLNKELQEKKSLVRESELQRLKTSGQKKRENLD